MTQGRKYCSLLGSALTFTLGSAKMQRRMWDVVESDMHSWSEATAGLHKHAPCGRNDVPARGHCLPHIPLFGQDSKNHIDFSSPRHVTSAPAWQRFGAHLFGINSQCGYSQPPCYVNIWDSLRTISDLKEHAGWVWECVSYLGSIDQIAWKGLERTREAGREPLLVSDSWIIFFALGKKEVFSISFFLQPRHILKVFKMSTHSSCIDLSVWRS